MSNIFITGAADGLGQMAARVSNRKKAGTEWINNRQTNVFEELSPQVYPEHKKTP